MFSGEEDNLDLWASVVKPFTPFSPQLWLMTLVALAYAGNTLAHQSRESRFSLFDCLRSVPSNILKGWNALFTGGAIDIEITNVGGSLTSVVVGFSIMVMITGYTAVVTTGMVSAKASSVTNIEQAIRRELRVCSDPILKYRVWGQFPYLRLVDVPASDLLDKMDAGECEGALVAVDAWHQLRPIGSKNCKGNKAKAKLPGVVLSVACTVPVSSELVSGISWAISKDVDTGVYLQYEMEAQDEFRPDSCKGGDFQAEKSQFGLSDMVGPLCLLVFVSTGSQIVTQISAWTHHRSEKLKAKLDEEFAGVTGADMVKVVSAKFVRTVSPTGRSRRKTIRKTTNADIKLETVRIFRRRLWRIWRIRTVRRLRKLRRRRKRRMKTMKATTPMCGPIRENSSTRARL